MHLTHSSTAKQEEEEQEERGSCQTLGTYIRSNELIKSKLCIIFLLFATINILIAEENSNNIINREMPKYENAVFFKDYRINQPIKGAIRWGSIGVISSILGEYYYYQGIGNNEMSRGNFDRHWEVFKTATICGSLIGLYKGIMFEQNKQNDSNFKTNKDKIGYQIGFAFSPRQFGNSKNEVKLKLIYRYDFMQLNEIALNIDGTNWFLKDHTELPESKYYLMVTHNSNRNRFFSAYYGFGGGISSNNKTLNWFQYDNYQDHSISGNSIYPLIATNAGCKLDFLDFFYIKLDSNFEVSSFYFSEVFESKYAFLANFSFGLAFGTKIF